MHYTCGEVIKARRFGPLGQQPTKGMPGVGVWVADWLCTYAPVLSLLALLSLFPDLILFLPGL